MKKQTLRVPASIVTQYIRETDVNELVDTFPDVALIEVASIKAGLSEVVRRAGSFYIEKLPDSEALANVNESEGE